MRRKWVFFILFIPWMTAFGQERARLTGQAFMDYYYILNAEDSSRADLNGFAFRRMYLGAAFTLSDRFSGLFRLEADDVTLSSKGSVAYVKDLYLRWNGPSGHRVTAGIASTPSFGVSERVWGYRSIQKTIMDYYGIVSSRDFGIRVDGPLLAGDRARFTVMVANNSSTRPETDRQKRVYGQLEAYPTDYLTFTVGADYAGYGDARDRGTNMNGFAGYHHRGFSVGLEAFLNRITYRQADDIRRSGVSLFAVAPVAEKWNALARFDRARLGRPDADDYLETLLVGGLAYEADDNVRIIPNLIAVKPDDASEVDLTGRITLEISF